MTPEIEAAYGRLMMREAASIGQMKRLPIVAGHRLDRDQNGRPKNLQPGTTQALIWDLLAKEGALTLAEIRARLADRDAQVHEALTNLCRRTAIRRVKEQGAPHRFEVRK